MLMANDDRFEHALLMLICQKVFFKNVTKCFMIPRNELKIQINQC